MANSLSIDLRRRPNKQDLYKVVIRIYVDGKSSEYTTNFAVKKNQFSKKNQKVIKHDRADKLNFEISKQKKGIEDAIFNLKYFGVEVNLENIKNKIANEDFGKIPSLVDFTNSYIEKNPDDLSPGTFRYYKTAIDRWEEKHNNIKLDKITSDHLIEFRNYLREKYKNSDNTIYNRIKVLKKMMLYAIKQGVISDSPFDNFTVKAEKGKREHLSMEELDLFAGYSPTSNSEELAQDVFLFGCYTGLRIGDICTLEKDHVQSLDKTPRFKKRIAKSKEYLEFSLNGPSTKILRKYHETREIFFFPLLKSTTHSSKEVLDKEKSSANAYVNRYLRKIIVKLDIKKKISMHCSRHTFATGSITKGADLYTLSKVLGHKSIKTTEIYAKLVGKKRDELMQLWNS